MAALAKCMLPILLVLPALAAGQTQPQPNLTHFTQLQLIACYENPKLCGAGDYNAVEGELKRRLSTVPSSELVRCFSDWHICGVFEDPANGWPISDELRRRGHLTNIIAQYGGTSNPDIRDGLEHLAYHSRNPAARAFLNRVLTERLDDGEHLYWPAMYLAKRCDLAALHYLDPGPNSQSIADNFSVSSAQFAETASLFGKCRYRPSIPYLVKIGLNAASLNLVDAADQSLRRFYPNSPHFNSLEAEQKYFCNRANHDSFNADCSAP
jgi:hypothetical protein